jgi:hypothetical protein
MNGLDSAPTSMGNFSYKRHSNGPCGGFTLPVHVRLCNRFAGFSLVKDLRRARAIPEASGRTDSLYKGGCSRA